MQARVTIGSMALAVVLGVTMPAWADGAIEPIRKVQPGRLGATLPELACARPRTERVSVDTGGEQANDGSYGSALSADGRFVAFHSGATNLASGDTNGEIDVFARDLARGRTMGVSVEPGGVPGNAASAEAAISANGQFVAFASGASNLVPGDTNGQTDVFVRDLARGRTVRASLGPSGTQGEDGGSAGPALSADGRFVAFWSEAGNLVSGDTNGFADVFVRDRQRGTTSRVSVGPHGAQADDISFSPAVSADGRFVAFESYARNLAPVVPGISGSVFVHDMRTGRTELVSVGRSGAQADGASGNPAISADGRFVAFASEAGNLVAGDTNGRFDVFVRDRIRGQTVRASVGTGGAQGNGGSYAPAISADGRFVAFLSSADNLSPLDLNEANDVFVRDLLRRETHRVSRSPTGGQAIGDSSGKPALSADGRLVAFHSDARNLVSGDTNGASDIFVTCR
jgi:Tol biopolymer transport system component